MRVLQAFSNLFDKPSIEEIAAYQHKIPSRISVSHEKEKDGTYVARVLSIDGKKIDNGMIITDGKTVEELVEMVNDAVYTYLDIPERIRPSLPKMLPSEINFADRIAKKGELVFAK